MGKTDDIKKLIAKWTLGAVALTALAFAPVQTSFAKDNDIHTVYHVYLGNESIGTMDNPELIKSFIDKKVKQAEKKHQQYDFTTGRKLSLVPEKVFQAETNNKQVFRQFKNKVTIKADVGAVQVGEDKVVYVQSEKKAKELVKKYKKHFVSEPLLKAHEKGQTKLEDGTELLKLEFSQPLKAVSGRASIKQIKDTDQAFDYLLEGNLTKATYKVKEGDVLVDISHKFDLSLNELLKLNPKLQENKLIHIGDKVTVKKPKPFVNVTFKKKVTKEETIDYKTETRQNDNMYKGKEKVVQTGKEGKQKVRYQLKVVNGQTVQRKTVNKDVISKPRKKIIEKGTKVIASRGTGNFRWPTHGGPITSGYGKRWGSFHKGIDIDGTMGTSILAADNGEVVSAGYNSGGYGKRIVIDHNNGFRTTYNHLSDIDVHTGQTVKKGQSIANMGTSGDSTGTHLHFEVIKNGSTQNPLDYVHR
ncbi:M23 family metallopeptidase [Tuberibacillus sp. Marseille-P3662]|uniref:M23 family metallopeptidase n=1 Tax=Tuberibacillus sp. Marseille-P3662 TaxID=1965358 RepID=UPI0015947D45|nr:M23 family metallopeptidase [Tuberibacillus sp. Marseille-P3662]